MINREYKSESGFDIRLEARLKNAALVNARESLNLTPPQASQQIGISYGTYLAAEAMRAFPRPETQRKICDFYRSKGAFLLEEEVFPQELQKVKLLRKYIAQETIPREQLVSLSYVNRRMLPLVPSVEEKFVSLELTQVVDDVLSTLTPKQKDVLRLIHGFEGDPQTYLQIGEYLGVTRERVRQIEAKALMKLRHSSRRRKLSNFIK